MSQLSIPLPDDTTLAAIIYPEPDTMDLAVQAGRLAIAVPPVLTTEEQALDCQSLLADCKGLLDAIEERRTQAKAPLLELGKRIDATAKAPTIHLESAIGILRSRLTQYAAAQAKARLEAEAQAQAQHDAAPDAGYTTPPITTEVVEAAAPGVKVSTRTHKTVRIVDDALVPIKFRPIDLPAVRRALMAGESVPGAELVIEKKAT